MAKDQRKRTERFQGREEVRLHSDADADEGRTDTPSNVNGSEAKADSGGRPTETGREAVAMKERRTVAVHRQCPLCYHGELNGVGVSYSTQGRTRYYKCDKCGNTWTALVRIEVVQVEHRRVDLDTR